MTKSELRKIHLKKQISLSGVERSENSRQIAVRFFDGFDLTETKFLHTFLPIEKNCEINTRFVFRRLWKDFTAVTVVAPRVDFETMKFANLRFAPQTKLTENRWHILEPTAAETVEIEKIDVCLVPLLCFDERGFRVGYGKGFYDKFLSECRSDCLKIGLSYFAPVAEISDAREFDVRLDYCVTPDAVLSFRERIVNGKT